MLKSNKALIALALIPQFILVKLLAYFPEQVERYYSGGIYPILSQMERYVFGWLPFSFGDLLYTFGGLYILRWLYKNRRRLQNDTRAWLVDVFAAISILYFAFHLLWGLNYYRKPLHENLSLKADYTTQQLVRFVERLIPETNAIHLEITQNDTLKVTMPYTKTEILRQAPKGYTQLKDRFPHLEYHPRSLKKSIYSVPLTYMGFSGYLNPLTNEAQVDYLIPAYKMPTTASHEIAHQLGYAAENEANFIGCLSAMNHDDIYFQYSGYVFGLRHCMNEIYRRDEALFEELVETINDGILKNYKEAEAFWDSYENPLEPLFKLSYNSFLKANNQAKGMESYNYVVALLVNYFEKHDLK